MLGSLWSLACGLTASMGLGGTVDGVISALRAFDVRNKLKRILFAKL